MGVGRLPIPQAVDEALGALGRRREMPKEIASLVFSLGRHVVRAFAGEVPDREEIGKIQARLDRCFALLAADPAMAPDGALGEELRSLAAAVAATASGPAVPAPPSPAPPRMPMVAVMHPAARIEPPRIVFRPRARMDAPPPPPPAPVARIHARLPEPPPEWEPLVIHAFGAPAAATVERDWYWFVLEELNGLGGLLAYQREHGEGAAAARTERRLQGTLDTLSWDLVATLGQTWSFVEQRLRDAGDAWGPHLLLFTLEPETERVRDWRNSLPREMQAAIEATPVGTQRETPRGNR